MPSSPEPAAIAAIAPRDFGVVCRAWNRRLHFYLGLYFLFFVWLFALTGLLLNHGSWSFADFWPNRKVANDEHAFVAPPGGAPLDQAHDLMRQFAIAGEIQWLTTRPDPNRFEFRVSRPGTNFEIQADLKTARAKIQRTDVNTWGIMRALHTFTGVRLGDRQNQRDWSLTTLWALAMDAVAAGLVVLVLSGVVMWWVLPGRKLSGAIALIVGVLVCGWFVVGLRLVYR